LTDKSTETDTRRYYYKDIILPTVPQPGGTSLPRLGEQRDKHRQKIVQKQIQIGTNCSLNLAVLPCPG